MKRKHEFIILAVKAVCGVVGGALILTEDHPYLSLLFLAIGAAANEAVIYFKIKQ
jgi:hypothetical protein